MLPPWWHLVLSIALLGVVGFVAARAGYDPDVVLPLGALGLLAVPYLPWLPDRLPVLRGLGGPARNLLWFVVAWLVIIRARFAVGWLARMLDAPIAIFITSVVVFGAAAWLLTSTPQFPSGDEPHYLVITQSLLKDGDFKIENNHQRGDFREYYTGNLRPDYLTRGKDRQIYSIHPVGLSILAVPAFAVGGYHGVVAMQVVIAAFAAVLLWQWTRETSGSASAALFAWAAAALTTPFLFNSFTVYPEIPGALAVLIALAWRRDATTMGVVVVKAIAIGSLPWLSTKYAPMAGIAAVIVTFRAGWNPRALVALAMPIAVMFAGWFGFFYWIWGTFSPSAPYGSSEPTTLAFLAHGGPGLLFDQEYGVVANAPVLALAFIGFAQMLRSGTAEARRALEVMVMLLALLVTVGAFRLWWGGSAVPGRPLASGVLLLGVPIASLFAAIEKSPSLRAVCHVLLASSLAMAVAAGLTQGGALLYNERDGAAAFLQWMSPTWTLTSVFPSFIRGSVAIAVARTLGWLTLGAMVTWVARVLTPRGFGASALATIVLGCAGATILASASRPASAAPIEMPDARARVPLLDRFDSRRRPLDVLYDPLSRLSSADALSRIHLVVRPGQRTGRQPVELLWNARYSLPAGEYRVGITRPGNASVDDAAVGLQIGRVGPPIEQWVVSGAEWERRIVLPIDTSLVGLRPLSPKGLAEGELRIVPVRVVNEGDRIARPPIISAARYGAVTVYFHDESTAGEPEGYWTRGRGTTQVTFSAGLDAPATIEAELRCGGVANRVTLSAPGWRQEVAIDSGASRQVSIPTVARADFGIRLAPVDIAVQNGFVPADVDAASSDRRLLGCWIDMSRSH